MSPMNAKLRTRITWSFTETTEFADPIFERGIEVKHPVVRRVNRAIQKREAKARLPTKLAAYNFVA